MCNLYAKEHIWSCAALSYCAPDRMEQIKSRFPAATKIFPFRSRNGNYGFECAATVMGLPPCPDNTVM